MKKLIMMLLVAMMSFTLVACGGSNNESTNDEKVQQNENHQTSDNQEDEQQQDEEENDETEIVDDESEEDDNYDADLKLRDLNDVRIMVMDKDQQMTLTEEESNAMLALIPDEIQKYTGTLFSAAIHPYQDGYRFAIKTMIENPQALDVIVDYLKTLDGEIVEGSEEALEMKFEWGTLYECHINKAQDEIQIKYLINGN